MRDSLLNDQLGKYIKTQRQRLHFSQTKVAKHLNISAQFYGKIEMGDVGCPPSKLAALILLLKLQRVVVGRIFYAAADRRVKELFDS